LLKIDLVKVPSNESYKIDPKWVKERINKNTVAIVGSAGSAELGIVDPIDKLSDIAVNNGIYLHVDGAFGGLVIPFLNELGLESLKFDFSLEGVQSITVDRTRWECLQFQLEAFYFVTATICNI
jgi:tyrosine decarboxylase/aspartate 1-decarboxylase